jgi:hypothetical protein
VILRNVTISPDDKATMLCLDLATFESGFTVVLIDGKEYRWDLSIQARSPQFLPIQPGFWQDTVLANLDALAGVAHREELNRVAGGFQFSHGTTTYLMDLSLRLIEDENIPSSPVEVPLDIPFNLPLGPKRGPGRPKKDAICGS